MSDRQNADVRPLHGIDPDAATDLHTSPAAPTRWAPRVAGGMGLDWLDEETSPECIPFHRTPAHACSDFQVSAHGEVLTLGEPLGETIGEQVKP